MRPLATAVRVVSLARSSLTMVSMAMACLTMACVQAPHTAYAFDPGPGGWALGDHGRGSGFQRETYTHEVHGERLEVWEIDRPSPGATSAEFATLAPAARVLPPLGTAAAVPRTVGDDELAGVQGYWVEQAGRVGDELVHAAVFVAPGGRRHFVVRMQSSEDDFEQLRAWLRDTLLRNFRLPAPVR